MVEGVVEEVEAGQVGAPGVGQAAALEAHLPIEGAAMEDFHGRLLQQQDTSMVTQATPGVVDIWVPQGQVRAHETLDFLL